MGLVLAGGGARGAYEVGVLSVLLPELHEDERPTILLGNSVGAINAMYLAANAHLSVQEMMKRGRQLWEGFSWSDVFAHLVSPPMLARAFAYLGQVLGVPGARLWSLLEPRPLHATIQRCIDFDQLASNLENRTLTAAGVVATSALTRRSVVFHVGGGNPPADPRRLIDYVQPQRMSAEHVLASTAIPAVFPSICVEAPAEARGWYLDGGTRLNVPIKPALELGAERVIAIGLSSLSTGPRRIAGDLRPDAFSGISHIVEGLLDDQMVQDVQTLARINALVRAGAAGGAREIEYIAIAPEEPDTVEQLAESLYRSLYSGLAGLRRSFDIMVLGRLMGVRSAPENATLLSMLLFDGEFAEALMKLGESDARGWISRRRASGSLWAT